MKLAEALIERANLQKRITEVKNRILRGAVTQEDIDPPEDMKYLLSQLNEMYERLSYLISKINLTNNTAKADAGELLSEFLAKRDVAGMVHAHYLEIGMAAVVGPRVGHSEIKFKANLSSAQVLKQADEAARIRRELDVLVQEMNWTVDLME